MRALAWTLLIAVGLALSPAPASAQLEGDLAPLLDRERAGRTEAMERRRERLERFLRTLPEEERVQYQKRLDDLERRFTRVDSMTRQEKMALRDEVNALRGELRKRGRQAMREWRSLPPEERWKLREKLLDYRELPSSEREALRDRYQALRERSPEDLERLRENSRRFREMSPEQRQRLREQRRRLREMSAEERRALREELRMRRERERR